MQVMCRVHVRIYMPCTRIYVHAIYLHSALIQHLYTLSLYFKLLITQHNLQGIHILKSQPLPLLSNYFSCDYKKAKPFLPSQTILFATRLYKLLVTFNIWFTPFLKTADLLQHVNYVLKKSPFCFSLQSLHNLEKCHVAIINILHCLFSTNIFALLQTKSTLTYACSIILLITI